MVADGGPARSSARPATDSVGLVGERVLAQVEVVDHLRRRRSRDVRDQHARRGRRRRAVPSDVSICWQKPCVVVIVAASNCASATASRCAPASSSSSPPPARCGRRGSADDAVSGRAARARRSTSRSRTRSRSSDVAARPKVTSMSSGRRGDPLGDVPGGQRRDRVRLARAGARLEHDRALRQRAADVEAARSSDLLGAMRSDRRAAHRPGSAEAGGLGPPRRPRRAAGRTCTGPPNASGCVSRRRDSRPPRPASRGRRRSS